MTAWWAEPTAGDIVWCHFPDNINPHPKPRPALILAVFDDDAPRYEVRVVYGTSQRTTMLHRGEFSILSCAIAMLRPLLPQASATIPNSI
jgi:hypothetical protein